MKNGSEGSPYILSESQEDYLEAIYQLGLLQPVVRVTDIAKARKVRAPSVTSALKWLSRRRLIIHNTYGRVTLTREGLQRAVLIATRHQKLCRFFEKRLKLDRIIANESACRMEHTLEPEVMERLLRFLETKTS